MGGLFLSGWDVWPRVLDRRESSKPLVVELIPLDGQRISRNSVATPSLQKRQLPSVGVGAARARPSLAMEPVKFASGPVSHSLPAASPAIGGGAPAAASRAEFDEYQHRLYEIVAHNSRYPGEAKRLRLSGITHLAFRVDRLGNVLDSWVQESSGSEMLDDAALDALRRSQPLPPIPPSLPSRMDFVIEIDSSLLQRLALSSRG